jgi:small-conductance mechanosensitive channel
VLQDTLQKQRDYVTANSNRLEHQLQLLQEAVNSKRLTLTEKPPGSGHAGRNGAYSGQPAGETGAGY